CDWVDLLNGSTVTLIEEPDTGYGFGGWGGGCTGTANHCTLTIDTDRTVTATFTQSTNTHVLGVSVTGNGTVTGGGIACTSADGHPCLRGDVRRLGRRLLGGHDDVHGHNERGEGRQRDLQRGRSAADGAERDAQVDGPPDRRTEQDRLCRDASLQNVAAGHGA